jgi:hypothetical protein
MTTRKTIDRETVVDTANRMIAYLSDHNTPGDNNTIRIHAIRNFTESILLADNAYKGFRYLDPPTFGAGGSKFWNETRIEYM